MAGNESNLRTGGRILVDCLKVHGVDMAFCVPGESYLPVLDALYDTPEIDLLTCRQEGGAAMMADAYGRLTGRPGICMVTRGPGATNASAGVHTASQDSTPMILFIGHVARDTCDREGFQEVDLCVPNTTSGHRHDAARQEPAMILFDRSVEPGEELGRP